MTDVVQQTLAQQAAALTLLRVPKVRIAEELNLTARQLDRLIKSDDFLTCLKDIGDRATALALNDFKGRLDELAPLAFDVLKQSLLDGKLEAVKVWATFVGVDKQAETDKGPASIQVFMPGAQQPKDIEAESKPVGGEE